MEFIDSFKKDDWTKRLARSQHLRKKYPDRLPFIVDRGNTHTPKLSNNKYLVPRECIINLPDGTSATSPMTVGQFLAIIRKHMPTLTPDKALFLFMEDNTMPPIHLPIVQLYTQYQSNDAFVYVTVTVESTFGNQSPHPASFIQS